MGICGATLSADSLGVSVGLESATRYSRMSCPEEKQQSRLDLRALSWWPTLNMFCRKRKPRAWLVKVVLQGSKAIKGETEMNSTSQVENRQVGLHLSRRISHHQCACAADARTADYEAWTRLLYIDCYINSAEADVLALWHPLHTPWKGDSPRLLEGSSSPGRQRPGALAPVIYTLEGW